LRLQGKGIPGYEKDFELKILPERLLEPLKKRKPTTFFVNENRGGGIKAMLPAMRDANIEPPGSDESPRFVPNGATQSYTHELRIDPVAESVFRDQRKRPSTSCAGLHAATQSDK
jgi:hypothetical protein